MDERQGSAQALAVLVSIFPSFREYVLDDALDSDTTAHALAPHRVMFLFAEFSASGCFAPSEQQLIKFCSWINDVVQTNDELENAVATCFLEHTKQLGVSKLLAPHLSKLAKQKSRA